MRMEREVMLPCRLVYVFLLLFSAVAYGQTDFSYSVEDWTTDEQLDIDRFHGVGIFELAEAAPRLSFSTRIDIYGCRRERFTYTVESCALDLTPAQCAKFLAAVRAFPLAKLSTKIPDDAERRSQGSVKIGGREYAVTTEMADPQRAAFHDLVMRFVDEVAPKAKRETFTRTIEGDFVPARSLTFETLLKTPGKFDGKRVRLTGYYHGEFEGSNFGPQKGSGYSASVWLGGDSTFAKPGDVERPNDAFITVEGTFTKGPAGHLGLWAGEIDRVSRIVNAKP